MPYTRPLVYITHCHLLPQWRKHTVTSGESRWTCFFFVPTLSSSRGTFRLQQALNTQKSEWAEWTHLYTSLTISWGHWEMRHIYAFVWICSKSQMKSVAIFWGGKEYSQNTKYKFGYVTEHTIKWKTEISQYPWLILCRKIIKNEDTNLK